MRKQLRGFLYLAFLALSPLAIASSEYFDGDQISLWEAADAGNFESVHELLKKPKLKTEYRHKFNTTPLLAASRYQHKDIIALLVKEGANPNFRDREDFTPLYYTARWGFVEETKLLIEAGADVNFKGTMPRSALMVAAEFGHYEVVKLLLENRADAEAVGLHGKTALSLAKDKGHSKIVKLLDDYSNVPSSFKKRSLKISSEILKKQKARNNGMKYSNGSDSDDE